MKTQSSKITLKFYIKMFSICFLFYLLVLGSIYYDHLHNLTRIEEILAILAVITSFFFPLSYKLAERFMEKPADSIHWKRGLALLFLILAIPLGLIEIVLRVVNFTQK